MLHEIIGLLLHRQQDFWRVCCDCGQLPMGAATPCKEQHKNNQLWQFGLVNGFFLPVPQLLVMRRRGNVGRVCLLWLRCCRWGLSVAQYTTNHPWGLLAGEEVLGMAEVHPAFLNHEGSASTIFPFSCTV